MGSVTGIEWTNATWNPWRGCTKVSPGCANCYMFREQRRYGRDPEQVVQAAHKTFYEPLKWQRRMEKGHITNPLLVFTCSWSDWFHEAADEWREAAWDVIRRTPDLTYQILTKRSERIASLLPDDWSDGYPNVWLGVTVEGRRQLDRLRDLVKVPARVRFLSAEPLLEDLRLHRVGLANIDWVIAGGESGGSASRLLKKEWVKNLRDVCVQSGSAFFMKQWGGSVQHKRGGIEAHIDGVLWRQMPMEYYRLAEAVEQRLKEMDG